jgi:hypothetical protein
MFHLRRSIGYEIVVSDIVLSNHVECHIYTDERGKYEISKRVAEFSLYERTLLDDISLSVEIVSDSKDVIDRLLLDIFWEEIVEKIKQKAEVFSRRIVKSPDWECNAIVIDKDAMKRIFSESRRNGYNLYVSARKKVPSDRDLEISDDIKIFG